MNRRAALALLAASGCPGLALAQPRVRAVGYLSNGATHEQLAGLLAKRGHIEGKDVRYVLQVKSGGMEGARIAALRLLESHPDVLVAFGAANVRSLAELTRTIPIVCGGTADPVGLGFAKSLRHPGGNITGLSYGVPEMAQILVGLVRVVQPKLQRIVTVVSAESGAAEGWGEVLRSIEGAARSAGVAWQIAPTASVAELERTVSALDRATTALYFVATPEHHSFRQSAELANARRLVTFTSDDKGVRDGMLMHYSVDHADAMGRVAAIVDQLLRGAKAGELPFELPDRTTFIVNRRTAKAIGVELPAEIIARATEILG
jgi:putative ABC transport system substrate-binding protein